MQNNALGPLCLQKKVKDINIMVYMPTAHLGKNSQEPVALSPLGKDAGEGWRLSLRLAETDPVSCLYLFNFLNR